MNVDFAYPRIEQIDVNDPGYVGKLDQGLSDLDRLAREQKKSLAAIIRAEFERTIGVMRAVPGASVELFPIDKEIRGVLSEFEGDLEIETVIAQGLSTRGIDLDTYEDIQTQFTRSVRSHSETFQDSLKVLGRSAAKFKSALYGFTTAEPLGTVNFDREFFQLYAPYEGKVYQAFLDLKTSEANRQVLREPSTSQHLTPADFNDEKIKQKFGREREVNVYLVRNPSRVLSPGEVMYSGWVKIVKSALEFYQRQEEKTAAAEARKTSITKALEELHAQVERKAQT